MPSQSDPDTETIVEESSSASNQANAPSSRANLIGMTLGGRYLVERELGRGGMGAVYLARDKPELHSRPVVVKVLLEEAMKNELVVSKFYQEIESLTRLDDPGVIGIFDAGRLDDGTPYLVMQYVEGTTLRAAMKPEGMDLGQAAAIIRQLGRSIAAAHEAGILHRDLKPENIMLRQTKSGEQQAKIIDFGIAKVKNSLSGPSPVTGLTVGTIGYMSPEQLSAKPLTPASDIYSLGVIAYEMVTGRRPFTPDSMFQLLEMQRAGVRVKPGDLRPSVPEAAQQVLLKALAFDPNDRYQDARQLGEDLARTLAGEAETLELPISSLAKPEQSTAVGEEETLLSAGQSINDGRRMNPHVFISYSSGDKKTADAICASLERAGLSCWIAPRNILPGKNWGEAIIDGISQSRVMVLVLSAKANESSQVMREVDRAVHKNVPIIPFRIEDVPPSKALELYLSAAHWLDAYTPPLSKHLEYLENTVRSIIDKSEIDVDRPQGIVSNGFWSRTRRWWLVSGALVLLMAIIAGAIMIATRSQRSLIYSLTVQKMSGGQPVAGELESTGRELFGNGWRFRVNVTPSQAGSLYLLDEGPVNYNVLFPTPANNNSVAQLSANQTMHTGWYFFDENTGTEKVWIIWSAQPLAELDAIFKDAAQHKLEIRDSQQIKTVRDILTRYGATETVVDNSRKLATIKGRGDVLISPLALEHNQY
jgi:serine/threonine protein kinase